MKIFNFKHIYLFFFCLLLTAFCENHSELNSNQEDNISYLKKINEITEFHSNDGINFFLYIDSLCCDEDNNLYVADSGWNKIFKFNADGQYLVSFGREGQGPGEFLARPGRYPLKISVGNDSNIYITDSKSERLSIFTDVGSYIKYFYLPPGLYGSAQINSKGEIYLISNDRENAISCYDKDFNLKGTFFNNDLHFKYPYYRPKWDKNKWPKIIHYLELLKMITKNDQLIVFSNNSLRVFLFNDDYRLVDEFTVDNERFTKDFKKKLRKAVSRGKFVCPFNACLDSKDNICFLYFNDSKQTYELYRYEIGGTFLDILIFPQELKGNVDNIDIDRLGNIYTSINMNKISVYRIMN